MLHIHMSQIHNDTPNINGDNIHNNMYIQSIVNTVHNLYKIVEHLKINA